MNPTKLQNWGVQNKKFFEEIKNENEWPSVVRVSGQANSIELEKAPCQAQSPDRQTKNKVNILYNKLAKTD